jgi:membrane peptidoglycan carboxypeptidase
MTIALMEPGFWQNQGFSWQSFGSLEPVTLSEKLVADLFLDQEPPGLRRSLRMRLLAAQVIRQYGQNLVLEWVLNSTYYGHKAYGADSAAYLYLNKPASELNLAETALLLAAAEAPALNPLDAPAAALERQQQVLRRLRGSGAISEQEYQKALQTILPFRLPPPDMPEIAVAFDRMVIEQLSQYFSQQRLERGGLRIVTSLDPGLQEQLACTIQTQLFRLEKQFSDITPTSDPNCKAALLLPSLPPTTNGFSAELQASAVILDPQNGQILAFLGDTGISGQTALVSPHQPGSLLTPFVAAASFGKGFAPASLVWDIPQNMAQAVKDLFPLQQKFQGPMRLRTALANDYLAPFAQLLLRLGPANVWRMAEPFGLSGLGSVSDPVGLLFG